MFHPLSSTAADNDSSLHASPVSPGSHLSTAAVPRSTGRTTLALGQITTYRQSFAEDVLACEQAGIGRIALWRRKLDEFGIDRAAELLQDHPLSISSLSWGGGFTGGNGLTFDEAVDETRTAIYQATRLRSHALTIVSGGRSGHIHSHARRLLLDGLAATVDIAAEHGITLALQPMAHEYADDWTFLDSLAEALDLVRSFDHPFLGLAVGTAHVWQEPRALELLREAAPYVATVQLSDWSQSRQDDNRQLPGAGEVPLAAMVTALQLGGYQGDYELDVWSAELWKQSPDSWLNSCVDTCTALISSRRPREVRAR